ncbi:lipid asymmetry maintenance protein MlaB [Trabulsiella odontotermitis]|uniref:lipid asymmetry maintenance protein MlaB n=1 Tax=Trabulsiella odontotermitis TaxID=379893 RepID=UPI003AC3B8DF
MANELSWNRENGRLSLYGELDQDWLVPLWHARADATKEVEVIDLAGVTRVDTAGLALLIHLIADIRAQGRTVSLSGKSENVQTLAQLYNLPADMIP